MLAIPVSFFISLFLGIVLIQLSWTRENTCSVLPKLTILVFAIQSVLIGLNWGYGFSFGWPVQGAIATLIPPLTWLTLREMVSGGIRRPHPAAWLAAGLPVVLVLASPLFGMFWVDFIVVAVFVAYGAILLRTAFLEPVEWLDKVPLHGFLSTNLAFKVAGGGLIASALIDLAVYYDITQTGGQFAPTIVGSASLVLLVVLALAIATVGTTVGPRKPEAVATSDAGAVDLPPAAPESMAQPDGSGQETPEELRRAHLETLAKLDELMLAKRVYRARKILIPARQISSAINHERGLNVPQYVNTFRIIEACELLKTTDASVTEIIYEVGFQTKSNFNREFLRVVGMSPRAWRQDKTSSAEPSQWTFFPAFVTEPKP